MSLDPATLNDMTGLHALITGAGSGIGLNIAKTYASHGATVYLVGRRLEPLQSAASEIANLGRGSAKVIQGDVSTREGIDRLVRMYQAESGGSVIDVLVANAGIFKNEPIRFTPDVASDPELLAKQLSCSTFDDWTSTVSINSASFYLLSGAFIPFLANSKVQEPSSSSVGEEDGNAGNAGTVVERPRGCVIVTSSIAGIHYSRVSSNPSYAASKAATNHLVKLLANRTADLYIRVNGIAPGIFPSEMNSPAMQKQLAPAIAKIPAGRMGRESEMGQVAVFLATCGYVTGQVICVDGGRTLRANGE